MSVYIHIPFCRHICGYCDFCKVLLNNELVTKYLISLAKEIDDYYNSEEINTIFIGGGTPSALTITDLKKLFSIIKVFKKTSNCEITFECNLSDINEQLISLLKREGVNRLSIGIESFNKTKLNLMERDATFKDALSKIKLVKKLGINNINVDLMYGIGNETMKDLKKDLKYFLKLPVTHISTYSLIIEEHTKFKINDIHNVCEDLEAKMYYYIIKKLKHHGFKQYELSNFCKKNYQSIHNMTYWLNNPYYGFGLKASGYIDDVRYENTVDLPKYLNGIYHVENNILSKKEIMDYHIMLGLRLIKGINIETFNKLYNCNIFECYPIKPLLKNKDLILKKGNISVNKDKLYIMNEILLKLL